jgi:hypothetical protein
MGNKPAQQRVTSEQRFKVLRCERLAASAAVQPLPPGATHSLVELPSVRDKNPSRHWCESQTSLELSREMPRSLGECGHLAAVILVQKAVPQVIETVAENAFSDYL